MAKGITVIVNADKEINDGYLTKLCANPDTTAWSLIYVDPETKQLDCIKNDGQPSADAIKDFRKDFKGRLIIQTMDYPKARDLDDIQPIILLTSADDKPLIYGMFSGDFSGSAKEKSSHMPFYHVAMEYLFPRIAELNEIAEGDQAKLVKALKSQTFGADASGKITTEGAITLMAADGDAWSYTRGDNQQMFSLDWGKVSNPLEADKPVAKKSLKDKFLSSAKGVLGGTASPIPSPVPQPQPEPTAEPDEDEDDTVTAPPSLAGEEARWDKHPGNPKNHPEVDQGGPPRTVPPMTANIMSVNKIIKMYKKRTDGGHPPKAVLESWPTNKALPAYISREDQLAIRAAAKKKELEAVAAQPTNVPVTSTKTDTIRESVPVIPAEEKTAIMEKFMPTVYDTDGNLLKRNEKEAAAQYGRPHPGFTQAFSLLNGLSSTVGWFFDDRLRLAKNHPYGAAVLLQEYTKKMIDQGNEIHALNNRILELTGKSVVTESPKKSLREQAAERKQRLAM